jgi:outer membrane protein TolC
MTPAVASTELLVNRRPDVVAASLGLTAANADVSVARAQRFPRVTLGGLIATIASAPAALFSEAATSAQGQGGLFLPLFDFGRIDASIAQATGARRAALADYRATLARAAADLDTAVLTVARRMDEAMLRETATASAERARATADLNYAAGALDLTVLLGADRAALGATEAAVTARAGTARALIALFRASAVTSVPNTALVDAAVARR